MIHDKKCFVFILKTVLIEIFVYPSVNLV